MTPDRRRAASGNPFPGSLVYSLGHRNVQGLAWDSAGRLCASEFGQNTWDEVNQIVAGGNYGWPTVEGMANDPRFRNPIVVWTTAEASPSGAEIDGNTLYVAALRGQRLWSVPLTGGGGVGTPLVAAAGHVRPAAHGGAGARRLAVADHQQPRRPGHAGRRPTTG